MKLLKNHETLGCYTFWSRAYIKLIYILNMLEIYLVGYADNWVELGKYSTRLVPLQTLAKYVS